MIASCANMYGDSAKSGRSGDRPIVRPLFGMARIPTDLPINRENVAEIAPAAAPARIAAGPPDRLCFARMASYLLEFQFQGGQACCKMLKIAMEGRVSPALGMSRL